MEAFLELFGEMRIASVVLVVSAIVFLWKIYAVIDKHFEEKNKKEQQLKKALEQVEMYPTWRKQSREAQESLSGRIEKLQISQDAILERMEKIEEENKRRERNKLRDRLLQSYRYYTSKDKNPMLAWSEMEKDAFWEIFEDYKNTGGNGHMHTTVKPAMRQIEVIPMQDADRIAELMHSRK